MLVLTGAETARLLEPDAVRRAVSAAMVDLSAGRASMPPRIAASVPEHDGLVVAMPAYLPGSGGLGAKLVSVWPTNAGSDIPTHQAVIVVFDADTGQPLALLDGTSITTARTAAASALSTDLLARPDAEVLAILGTGVQARAHAEAVTRVRPFRQVRIAGRDPARAALLADDLRTLLDLEVVAVARFEEACAGADAVCATTHAAEPVVRRALLAPGVHVTSVGYNVAGREVDSATVADALVVVESRASALAEPPSGANDLTVPIAEGVLRAEDVVELGELVAGTRDGRSSADQLTLYKSVGVAVQDVATATLVLAAARAAGVGLDVEI